jgi:hypothetical protein
MKPLSAKTFEADKVASVLDSDDIEREVYGILGIPVDAVDMASTLERITAATVSRKPFLF